MNQDDIAMDPMAGVICHVDAVDVAEVMAAAGPGKIVPLPPDLVPAHWPFPLQGRARAHVSGAPVVLTLPYPLSANRYWRSFVPKGHVRAVTTISQEAKDYRASVADIAKAMGLTAPVMGRVHIDIKLYPNRPQDWQQRMRKLGPAWDDGVQCLDLDNARKVVYDSLKGVVIGDDKWVRSDSGERMEPDEEGPRLVVTITPLSVETPQGALL